FVDLPEMTPEELGVKFTLATCEVEEVIKSGELLNNVTIARVESMEKHPDADKLNLVTFSIAEGETKRVVCGAPNVKPGIKVPYAALGTRFPDGFTLEPKKIRGILSEGMLCSERELGLSEEASGLMILPEDAPIGQTMADFMAVKEDVLLDIDNKSITHRPDLWGHYGMAREFATVFRKELKNPYDEAWEKKMEANFTDEPSPIAPKVHEDSYGLAYYGLTVKNVTIKESPAWMQQRLIACGLRPISNIVDISNYVMLETGNPNHLFDLASIGGQQIIVRPAGEALEFVTLDEEVRQLLPTDSVVCDAEKPLVIGGIMGGLNSGINDNTKDIFIEVANWVDVDIRKTSARLGLRTDSSQRFEKSLDTRMCKRALYRILELVLQLCPDACVVGKLEWDGVDAETAYEPMVIDITSQYICGSLGKQLETAEIISILESLAFKVTSDKDNLKVEVPSFRATKDIDCNAAIVEEIGRIIGYDNITPESPMWSIEAMRLRPGRAMQRKIQDFLVLQTGALEIFTYPMVGEKLLNKAHWQNLNEKLVLLNGLSKDHDRMRPSSIPGMLQAAALNSKNFNSCTMFEYGRSYESVEGDFSRDRNQVVVGFYSRSANRFVEAVNCVEGLMRSLKMPVKLMPMKRANPMVASDWKGLHPHETMDIVIMGKSRGFMTTVHPAVCREFKIKGNFTLVAIDLADFENMEPKVKKAYKPLPRYPHSVFDCTVVTDIKTPVEDVLAPLGKLKMKELVSSKVVVVFNLDEMQKTVTIRSTFFDEKKTLSGESIKEAEERVIGALEKAGFPLKH
ncbi:MAG: phenylalanine--tRNA ligase subunit beta, partial [bacterium]|nr:phenylalanine--tRNA ligase subunit beta [bacterium]